jgi:CPA2 family monovalent cation:H+ antiporter-2
MHDLAPIITDLAVILGVASFVTLLFQWIHQPVVLGYLVAGIIVGPHLLTHSLLSDIPNIKAIAELGVIFLMFSLGLEFSFHKLVSVGFSASITGLLEVILMMVIGFGVGHAIGWSFYDSLFLGAALSISSTTIIIKALEELGLKTKRFAQLIFGVLIVEDLLAILLLVILTTIVQNRQIMLSAFALDVLQLVVVVGSWFLIGYFLVPFFFRRVIDHASQETLTIVSIAFCLLLVCCATYFNYSPALGAFIMGSILAETPQVHRIEELIRPIRDIFAAVFFVSVGMLIDPKLIFQHLPLVLLLSLITVVGKIVSSSVGALLTGQSLNTSLRVGFGMAQIGEFSFIIVTLGVAMNATTDILYPIVVAVSVVTTFTTPYLILFSGRLVGMIERRLPESAKVFLNNYSVMVYRTLADSKASSSYRKLVVRLLINGLIVAVIFTLINVLMMPYVEGIINKDWLVQVICWITALTLSSPFIWAMLFAIKSDVIFSAANKNYSLLLISTIWVMVIAEILFLTIAYFYTWVIVSILFALAFLFFALFYAKLGKFYYWFETNFLANINITQRGEPNPFEKLAPWDNSLASLTVSEDSPLINKNLQDCEVRQKYGINIVAIQRKHNLIVSPRGGEFLLPYDKLVVLGTDEQLDAFRKVIETPEFVPQSQDMLSNFILKPFLLKPDSALIGKSIRDSQIREMASGLVAGLERLGQQILNPDPATILQEGDLLLLVGEAKYINELKTGPIPGPQTL